MEHFLSLEKFIAELKSGTVWQACEYKRVTRQLMQVENIDQSQPNVACRRLNGRFYFTTNTRTLHARIVSVHLNA